MYACVHECHLVVLHQVSQRGMLQLVHAQEAVRVSRGVNKEMFAVAVLCQVGEGIAFDLLADPDQEGARHTRGTQQLIGLLQSENPWWRERAGVAANPPLELLLSVHTRVPGFQPRFCGPSQLPTEHLSDHLLPARVQQKTAPMSGLLHSEGYKPFVTLNIPMSLKLPLPLRTGPAMDIQGNSLCQPVGSLHDT